MKKKVLLISGVLLFSLSLFASSFERACMSTTDDSKCWWNGTNHHGYIEVCDDGCLMF